ncbi:MAG: tetratricopeptide repeat protein [Rhodospirillaceae bacterium]|nr:tetratricopeptide repeat protein [Rhodospirillaceae bacterium]
MPRSPKPPLAINPYSAVAPRPSLAALDAVRRQLELGLQFHRARRLDDAERTYRQVLAQMPDQPDALNLLGTLYAEQGRITSALPFIEQAAARRRNDPAILNNLGLTYFHAARYDDAERVLRKALRIKSDFNDALINLGRTLRNLGKPDEAIECYRRALRGERRPAALIGLAWALAESGSLDEAVAVLRDLLAANPNEVHAYTVLAKVRRFEEADPEPASVEALLAGRTIGTQERVRLHYAAGKIMNDLGRYDRAMEHFIAGKKLESADFDPDAHDRLVDRIIETFTPALFDRLANAGDPTDRPIFIVGMPRSGTTLTEQILASHPDVHGAGELTTIRKLTNRVRDFADGGAYPEGVARLDAAGIAKLAAIYRDLLAERSPTARRVTDKMPHNFLHLGLIQVLFPNSRIVHCRRNPVDTCVSCFMNEFADTHGYSRDLGYLARYYRAYDRLMAHWRTVLRLPMLEFPYEETVAEPEARSRALVEFAGLEWNDHCLDFHRTDRSVQTISLWQVRQPIYGQSVERWRRYERFLGPLLDGLGDLAQ